MKGHPRSMSYFKHESAYVDEPCEIGEGTKIWHFSHVQSGAKIGKQCVLGQNVNVGNNVTIGNFVKIQNNVSVYEGVILEDYVFCGPSMVFTNILNPRSKYPQVGAAFYVKTLVKEGASLGANSTIVCGITIGRFAMVGAGAAVTKDVPDYALVVGDPARIVGWWSEGGSWISYPDIRKVPPTSNTTYPVLASQVFKPGTNQKYRLWEKSSNQYFVNHADILVNS
jgi:UDP-2-acetamido-3-amino-2,3-dideoxy-glucuronate N-acetyltransferase